MLVSKISGKLEIFYTFQGEGAFMGRPAIFVRLATCNLHCKWCDTPYTWNWEKTPFQHDKGKKYDFKSQVENVSVERLCSEINSLVEKNHCFRVVLTGGEPLLQQQFFPQILAYFEKRHPSLVFEIETNGTVKPIRELLEARNVFFNVSPKLAHSGNEKARRYNKNALTTIVSTGRCIFKFVVENKAHIREIRAIQRDCQIPNAKIYLMPLGTTKKGIEIGAKVLAEI